MSTSQNQPLCERYKHSQNSLHTQISSENVSIVNERIHGIKLRHHSAKGRATHSFYDNYLDRENQNAVSKWATVRQRLPDILALSETYKPSNVRSQLILLIALMNKQANELMPKSNPSKINEFSNTVSHIVPSSVIIDISGRSQSICLKRIPSEQMIHVDVNGLSFSIPTRQFILAISRGSTHETVVKYCPPAIREMLIDLSKTKVVEERQQHMRAQMKMCMGKVLFFIIFIFIIAMMLTLMLATTDAIFKFELFNKTLIYPSMQKGSIQDNL